MLSSMAGPKVRDDEGIPSPLKPLVQQLAALRSADRECVVRAARWSAAEARRYSVNGSNLRDACGVVRLGGEDDARALCDG